APSVPHHRDTRARRRRTTMLTFEFSADELWALLRNVFARDLKNRNLRGAQLGESDLSGVKFCGSDLTGADFTCSILTGGDLRGATGLTAEQRADFKARGAIVDD